MMNKNHSNGLAKLALIGHGLTEPATPDVMITEQALAQLGDGKVAYVKAVRSDDIATLFPNAPEIAPGLELFVLLSANGTPLVITDSADAAKVNAWNNDLETLSLH
jgi:hypothetical protein